MLARVFLSTLVAVLVNLSSGDCCRIGFAEDVTSTDSESKAPLYDERTEQIAVPQKVEVAPTASDTEIANRLQKILEATGWFTRPMVSADGGVVFITGKAKDEEVKEWASNLAARTEGVTAVVNKLQLSRPSLMNLDPAWQGLMMLWRDSIAFLPFIAFGVIILAAFWFAARFAARGARESLLRRLSSRLLRNVLAPRSAF